MVQWKEGVMSFMVETSGGVRLRLWNGERERRRRGRGRGSVCRETLGCFATLLFEPICGGRLGGWS